MHRLDALGALAALACASLFASGPAAAQERIVVSNTVVVSGDEASLHLEFSDGDHLSLSFADGVARVGDEILGRFEADGEAERAWRELLADVLPLTNGPLARRLHEWEPGQTASPTEHELLADVDETLESALVRAVVAESAAEATRRLGDGDWATELAEGARIKGFWDAVRHIDPASFVIVAGEDHVVPGDAVVEEGILVADGRLDVHGTVRGGVVLVDATMAVHEGGRVLGDVRHVDSRVERMGGVLVGDVLDVVRERRRNEERERDRMRAQLRRELRTEDARTRHYRGPSLFDRVREALSGIVATVVLFVVLGVLGAVAAIVAGDRGDMVAKEVERYPARSAAVGLAGAFLAIPVYVLGIVALAVTIIGILGLPAWIPLFPLAAAAAFFVGLVAASRSVGRWVLDRGHARLSWANPNDRVHACLVGLAALLLPMAVGKALDPLPLIGWTGDLFEALSTMALFAATITGLGAVLTTRGGRRLSGDYAIHDDLDAAAWSGEGFSPRDADRAGRPDASATAPDAGGGGERAEAHPAGDGDPAAAGETAGNAAGDPSEGSATTQEADQSGKSKGKPGKAGKSGEKTKPAAKPGDEDEEDRE